MRPDNRFDTHNGEHRFEWDSGHRIEPVFEMTKAYIDELEASVEYLRNENIGWEDMYRELASRYARLIELVRDMWHDGMCECDERGACAQCEYHFPDRMRELGVEVDE